MANKYGYKAGVAPVTVDVPGDSAVTRVSVVAGSAASATVVIAGGDTITIPAGMAFDEQVMGDAPRGGDVVIGGTIRTFYVAWMS